MILKESLILNSNAWNHLTYGWYWIELFVFDRNTWNHSTVFKQMSSGSFKNETYKQFFTNNIFDMSTNRI